MAVEKLRHIQVLVLDKHLDNLLAITTQMGVIELLNYRETADETNAELLRPIDVSEKLVRFANMRKRVSDISGFLGIDCSLTNKYSDRQPLDIKLDDILSYDTKIDQVEKNVNSIVTTLSLLNETKQKLEKIKQKLEFLLTIDFNIGDLSKFSFIEITMGRISVSNLSSLEQILTMTKRSVIIYPLHREGNTVYVILFYLKSFAEEMRNIFNSVYLETYDLPANIYGTPKEIIEKTEKEIKLLSLDIQKNKIELEQLKIVNEQMVKEMFYKLCLICKVKEMEKEVGGTEKVYLINGWIPQEQEKTYQAKVHEITSGTILFSSEDAIDFYLKKHKKINIPTLLKNHKMFKPFESLIEMYGKPAYSEFDPTPVFGISFLLMFGMMFGDIGQGLVLFLLGLFIRYRWREKLGLFAHLLRSVAVSSMFFGTLYGECFGFEIMHPLWLSPMKDTMNFLMFSVGFGILFMTAGIGISLVNYIRSRSWGNFLFAKNGLAGLWFYWGTILFFVLLGVKINLFTVIAIWLVPIILMFFKEPLTLWLEKRERFKPHNIVDFVIEAFFELVDTVISFLSNTISFVRIAAFALNHIGLFAVVKIITQMVTVKNFDGIIDFFILALGNILIICVEGLIVTIQVLRLEYYEFFSKFFVGNGTSFKPAKMV